MDRAVSGAVVVAMLQRKMQGSACQMAQFVFLLSLVGLEHYWFVVIMSMRLW